MRHHGIRVHQALCCSKSEAAGTATPGSLRCHLTAAAELGNEKRYSFDALLRGL